MGTWLCCGRAVAQPHEGMPWLLGSLLTLAVPRSCASRAREQMAAPGCDHTSICPHSSCLGAGSSLAGKEPSTPALSHLGILIREVQAWGSVWLEGTWCPGAAHEPSQAGTALTWPMGTDLLPLRWHRASSIPHLHALAALPTDSEHPFLCQVHWEQDPRPLNCRVSAGCALGGDLWRGSSELRALAVHCQAAPASWNFSLDPGLL